MQGGMGHAGAADETLDVVVCNDVFDGLVSRGTRLLFFAFGGDDGSVCERFNFDIPATVLATLPRLGAGLAYNLSKLFTKPLSARGIGSPSLMKA